jgi:tetratricopeptide (TPR) repeat protein
VVDGVLTIRDDHAALEATIPTTLPPLIQRELADLDADEVELVEACAVVGDAFDAAAVAAALERSTSATEDALAALSRRRGLIGATGATAWPDGTISASYAFVQQIVREVVGDRIAPSRRAELHGRVGRALEAGYGERAGEIAVLLAEHSIEAGDTWRAVEYLTVAGERANARNAHGHAIGFVERAIGRLQGVPASPERDRAEVRARMALGPALVATHGWFDPSVATNYERALELCGDDPGGPEAAAARYGLATVSELQGRFERTEALLTPLLAAEADGPLAIEAHALVACSMFHQGAFERSLRNARMVLDSWDEDAYSVLMARIAEHPASSCSSWSSLALWALGRSDESLALAERAVELGELNLYALSTAVQQRAMLHQLRNEIEPCIEWSQRCHAVGVEQGYAMRTIQADIYQGWALGVSGRSEEGLGLITDGLDRFRAAAATLNEAYYLGMYADVLVHTGHPERALDELATAADRTTSRTYFYEPELHRLSARAHLAIGGPDAVDQARRQLDDGREVTLRQGAVALELRILADRFELEAEHGDPARWREPLAALLAVYDGQRPTPDTERARSLLERPQF